MGRLIANTFVTLDGVMQAPGAPDEDRTGGFAYGGWTVPHWTEEMMRTIADGCARMDALLLGRGTYDIFAAHWPRVSDDDPVARVLNNVPKHVVMHEPRPLEWRNATAVSGADLAREVVRLRDAYAREIQIHGSWGLLQSLNAEGLVDEYRLWVFPVTVGAGKRLFGDDGRPSGFRLASARPFESGVVVLHYERAGAPAIGSFALDERGTSALVADG